MAFQYDGLGRITQTDRLLDGTTYTTQSTYDGLGRLLTVTYPSTPAKTISYAYNGPVLDKVFEGTTTYIQYTNYNALGQAGTTTYGNGVSTTRTYANANNSVCTQQHFRLCTLKTNGPGSGGGGGGGGTSTTYSSVADFSGTQGFHGWYYLSSSGTQLTWNGNFWSGSDGYIGLWDDGGHPGNSTDVVRRWVAPSAGSIQITGTTFDGDTSCGVDGVQVTIKKNGTVLWQQTIAAGNTTGYSLNLSNTVATGDQLDFVTNKLTTSACDNTVFTATIALTTSGGGGGGSAVTYNAITDFSSTQGFHGWYYLSSTGAQLTWNGNFWSGTDGYIGLWNDGGHPGNSTDAVRRWVAPSAGTVQITGTTFDGDTSCGIDGVQVTIKKNGAVLWQQTIAAGDTTGYSFNLSNTVVTGDQLDFVTNKLTTSACDNTVFRPTIVLTTSGGGGGSSTTYSAVADFSGIQGQQGWYYLSSTGAQLTWNGNFWSGTDGYIGLWDDGGHPGNSTDAVRRWVAPAAGSVQITGTTFDGDTSCGVDGVLVTIKKNGTVLWQQTIAAGDTTGYSFNLSNTVAQNDQLDFVTNKLTTSACDNTVFMPTIVLTTGSGGGSSGTAYQDLRYVYTVDGNVSDIYDNLVAGGAGDQHLSYDGLSRLTLANGPYGTNGANASLTYTYDELGNLTFNTQVGIYTYPTSGTSSVRPHAVTTAGSNTYNYDANGNMTVGAGRTLTYNLENKPLSITIAGQTTTFVYDGDGGRVKKVAGSTTTRYISKLYECDNTSCSRMIFAGSVRIATSGSGGIVYYHPDHLGSSSVITDSAGVKVQGVTYYPYGATRTSQSPATPAIDVAYKYTGKELDTSTNLYYYEARYYDPTLGRFLSADTLVPNPRNPQDINRYTYAHNNPFKYVDPTGHFSIKIGKFIDRVLDNNVVRAAGWFFIPQYMLFLDPATRSSSISALAGAIAFPVCGPTCSGAAAGATNAALQQAEGKDANIIRGAIGGAAGSIAAGLTSNIPHCGALCSFAAAGATNAAINKRDPAQGAIQGLVSGAIAAPVIALVAAVSYHGHPSSSPGTAKPEAVHLADAMNTDQSVHATPVGNYGSTVARDSIRISNDGILYFKVLTGASEGASVGARIQTGMLPMDLSGNNAVNFRDFAYLPGIVQSGQVDFALSVHGIQGPAYLRIIPDGLVGPSPTITNFMPGGHFIPCNPCGSDLNYDQSF